MFVDSHCHLEMDDFNKDRAAIIDKSLIEGLTYILTVGTEEKYFDKVLELVNTFPPIYGAIGIHPHNSTDYNADMGKKMTPYLKHAKIVALGEIGLDFFRNHSPRNAQVRAFQDQIELAKELGLPIIVHSRESKEETLSILKESADRSPVKGVIHCFSYDLETAKKFLDMGFYISIPGTITYGNNNPLTEAVKYIPLSRLLAETDAPFLTPQPHRGKRNMPYFVKITINRLALIKDITTDSMAAHIQQNFRSLFLGAYTGGAQ
ncbi:MAG: hydrolase TatD [Syntrophus sp. (in: bacteria)]|nr:hydrolase TatD [Syntrophus sp. (in: bacteria)]